MLRITSLRTPPSWRQQQDSWDRLAVCSQCGSQASCPSTALQKKKQCEPETLYPSGTAEGQSETTPRGRLPQLRCIEWASGEKAQTLQNCMARFTCSASPRVRRETCTWINNHQLLKVTLPRAWICPNAQIDARKPHGVAHNPFWRRVNLVSGTSICLKSKQVNG